MYGILKSTTNTGLLSELLCVFVAPIMVISNRPSSITETLSLKRKVSFSNAQRWEIQSAILPIGSERDFMIHSAEHGIFSPFPVRMPQTANSENTLTNTLNTFGTAITGSDTVTINGTNASLLLAGEFINFSGSQKVYMIKNVTINSVNSITIKTLPSLLTNVNSNTVIKYGKSVTMMAYSDSANIVGIQYVDGKLAQIDKFGLIEAI